MAVSCHCPPDAAAYLLLRCSRTSVLLRWSPSRLDRALLISPGMLCLLAAQEACPGSQHLAAVVGSCSLHSYAGVACRMVLSTYHIFAWRPAIAATDTAIALSRSDAARRRRCRPVVHSALRRSRWECVLSTDVFDSVVSCWLRLLLAGFPHCYCHRAGMRGSACRPVSSLRLFGYLRAFLLVGMLDDRLYALHWLIFPPPSFVGSTRRLF